MTDELKPVNCGCGGEAKVQRVRTLKAHVLVVMCKKCQIATDYYTTEAEAIQAWNRAMGADHFREGTKKVERKTGEWIKDEDVHRCSECHAVLEGDDWTWRNNYYCYHCGAKMKGWEK